MRTVADVDIAGVAMERIPGMRKEARTGGGEWHGPCPACGGTDRLVVNATGGTDGRGLFWCRGCGASGDAVALVQLIDHVPAHVAMQTLGVGSTTPWQPRSTPGILRNPQPESPVEPPPDAWQAMAMTVLESAQGALWSDDGAAARAYLHGRGFTDATIEAAGLGYIPQDQTWDRAVWGLPVEASARLTVQRGILIPYLVEGTPWRLEVRRPVVAASVCAAHGANLLASVDVTGQVWRALGRVAYATPAQLAASLRQDVSAVQDALAWLTEQHLVRRAAKYVTVAGSSNTVWGVDTWQPGRPGVIVEGALNGMAIRQAAPDWNVAALGAATHGRKVRWVMALSRWSQVLVALDRETDPAKRDSIEQAAAYWVEALYPKAQRWLPLTKDANAMLMEGMDVAAWLDAARQDVRLPSAPPARPTCAVCGAALASATQEVCADCARPPQELRHVTFDTPTPPDDTPTPAPVLAPPSAWERFQQAMTRLTETQQDLFWTWHDLDDQTSPEGMALHLRLISHPLASAALTAFTTWKQEESTCPTPSA